MKYGEQLERQSVPQWSLHNLDYNSLKHEIKVHTSRHQATAIAIPGHQDTALHKFEDGLYLELCRQHERVDLFVSSKASEITRRLDHLENSINRWIQKLPSDPSTSQSIKEQRRFAKYERELLQCRDDIQHIVRFANAQVVAFRKIVKKYRKWTGSLTLGSRFSENILSNPKSFTRRDFSPLRFHYEAILSTLRTATPQLSEPSSPSSAGNPTRSRPGSSSHPAPNYFDPLPPPKHNNNHHQRNYQHDEEQQQQQPFKYWNEYDDGSETGAQEDDYAIYIDPNTDDSIFPGIGYVHAILSIPFEKAKQWFRTRHPHGGEFEPLLSSSYNSQQRPQTYNSTNTFISNNNMVESDSEEGGYASSTTEYFPSHHHHHYVLPTTTNTSTSNQQEVLRYRESVLFWTTICLFTTSFALLAICSVLISTGRHKLRVEVDAAVTMGVAMSLFCSCSALAAAMYRNDGLSVMYRVLVGGVFVTSCILNGMLLVLVVGNAP